MTPVERAERIFDNIGSQYPDVATRRCLEAGIAAEDVEEGARRADAARLDRAVTYYTTGRMAL